MSIVSHSTRLESDAASILENEQATLNHVTQLLRVLAMAEKNEPFIPYTFRDIHQELFPYGGYLRETDMCFSKGTHHMYASVQEKPMWMWLADFLDNIVYKKSWLSIAEHHYQLLHIHPFDDGNGRIARLFTNYECRLVGRGALRICAEWREDYLEALEQVNITKLANLFKKSETTWR